MSEQIAETAQQSTPNLPVSDKKNRTTEVTSVATLTAFFALGALALFPSWPLALGVVAACAMAGVVCYLLLTRG